MEEQLKQLMETMKAQGATLEQIKGVMGRIDEMTEKANGNSEALAKVNSDIEKLTNDIADTNNKIAALSESASKHKGIHLPGGEAEAHKFSITRLIGAIVTKSWDNAQFEEHVIKQAAKHNSEAYERVLKSGQKVLSSASGAAGAYLIPEEFLGSEFIPQLYAMTVCKKSGARELPFTGSPVKIPRQDSSATASFVAPGTEQSATDLTFGQVSMEPHLCSAIVRMTDRLIGLGDPSVDTLVEDDIKQQIALAIDSANLRGSGTGENPLGLNGTSGVTEIELDTNGKVATFKDMGRLVANVELNNALVDNGSFAFVTNPLVKWGLKQERIAQYSGQTDGEYVVPPIISDKMLAEMLGYPINCTTQIPRTLQKGTSGNTLTETYFGDWRQMVMARWGGMSLLASQLASSAAASAFTTFETWIRAGIEVDVGILRPTAFAFWNDAETDGLL